MAQWQPLIGGVFASEILSPLSGIVNAVDSVLGPIQTILSLVQSILSIIRVFLVDAASLLLAVIQTLVNQITNFINQLANAGVYYLLVGMGGTNNNFADYVQSMTGGFKNFVTQIVNSFDDVGDPNRPTFDSNTQCGGVIYALNTGNIADVITFFGMFFRQAATVFGALYRPPTIKGFAANNTNVIVFERPNIPQNFFSNINFRVQRAQQSGGTVQTTTATNNASGVTTTEPARDPQNPGNILTTWEDIAVINQSPVSAVTLAPQRYIIVDGDDEPSPNLLKFDLTKKASSRASTLATSSKLGPSTFTLVEANAIFGNILGNFQVSTLDDINDSGSNPTGQQGDAFKQKYIGNYWLDFRINGFSVPNSAALANGGIYVQSFDGKTITLSGNVPLGAKVLAYTYVQAKASDVILQTDLNASQVVSGLSAYTKEIESTADAPDNNTPYFYRVVITPSTSTTIMPGGISNEIRLTPRAAYAPNPTPAYCLSGNAGPYIIPPGQNTLSFTLGTRTYNVALRPSRSNVFSANQTSFYQNFGLTLDPAYAPSANVSGQTTQTPGAALTSLVTGVQGLTFQYTDYNLVKHNILPGQYIPVELDDVLLDLETQCKDGNVRFFIQNGHIGIQDIAHQTRRTSSVTINQGSANSILGFTVGTCMNVAYSTPPDWGRIAVKDIFPQIYTLAEIIQSFANGVIAGIETGVKALVDFIDLLSTKIKVLQDFLTQIQNLLNELNNLKLQLPNMWKLEIPAGNGVTYLKSTISGATNAPQSGPNDLSIGIVLIIGGPFTGAVLPLIQKIL